MVSHQNSILNPSKFMGVNHHPAFHLQISAVPALLPAPFQIQMDGDPLRRKLVNHTEPLIFGWAQGVEQIASMNIRDSYL